MTNAWARTGGLAGAAAALIYLSLVFLPLPRSPARLLFFSLSLLIVVAMLGIYHVQRAQRSSILLEIAAIFTAAPWS